MRPTAGEALVFGRRYAEHADPARRVGAVLESADFHPGRSGREHLIALALAAGLPIVRADEVLGLVDLEHAARRPVKTYSLGMRQRLGLAAALLGEPELLVLDEPANGLDPEGVHWLRTFIRDFATEGKTVLVSSHLLAEVSQTVDRVVIIDKGKLVTTGQARRARAGIHDARERFSGAHVEEAVVRGQFLSELRKMRTTRTNLVCWSALSHSSFSGSLRAPSAARQTFQSSRTNGN